LYYAKVEVRWKEWREGGREEGREGMIKHERKQDCNMSSMPPHTTHTVRVRGESREEDSERRIREETNQKERELENVNGEEDEEEEEEEEEEKVADEERRESERHERKSI